MIAPARRFGSVDIRSALIVPNPTTPFPETPMSLVENLSRWMHLLFGILWIGHLYYFNFVQAGFEGKLAADLKKSVIPENRPRALYWFRWGAMWTFVTGILLVGFNYHMNRANLGPNHTGMAMGVFIFPLFIYFLYDIVAKKVGGGAMSMPSLAVNLVLFAGYMALCHFVAKLGGRALWIHAGMAFGITMMMNVWMRIWPAQRKMIAAIKEGTAPDPALVGLAGARSRHNTYMSVPLLMFMFAQHSDGFYNAAIGALGENSPLVMVFVTAALGFFVANLLYKKAGQLTGA